MKSFESYFPSVFAGIVGSLLLNSIVVGVFVMNPRLQTAFRQWVTPVAVDQPTETKTVEQETPVAVVSDPSLEDVVSSANEAVVSIVITKDVPTTRREFFTPFEGMPNLRVPRDVQNGTEKKEVGGGSGFLISKDGYIVTNNHVVADDAATYTVFLKDGSEHLAKIIAKDSTLDVALLKIEGTDFPMLSFGDSDTLRLGQTVVAIGNALSEFRNTVSVGVVSGLSRSIIAGDSVGHSEQIENVIQTDAAINPGNSGGPLLDDAGRVVGVNVAVANNSQSIGFALPANAVKPAIESMKEFGRVIRPYLGVRYVPITPELREKNAISVDHGALVLRGESADLLAVLPGSPADKAGIKEQDILLEVDGEEINEDHSLGGLIRKQSVGDRVTIKYSRGGVEQTTTVTLEEMPQISKAP